MLPVADTLEEQQLEADAARRERWARFFFDLGRWLSQSPPSKPSADAPGVSGAQGPASDAEDEADAEPDPEPSADAAGAGSGWPFDLPAQRPTGRGEVSRWGRRIAEAMREAIAEGDLDKLEAIRKAVEKAGWLDSQLANIMSALDPPRTLEELNEAAQVKGTHPGRDDHHIIEQGDQNSDVPREVIDGKENLVRIPRYKHWQVNGYYQTPRDEFDGLTPREYLKGKSIEERRRVGLDALRKFGIIE